MTSKFNPEIHERLPDDGDWDKFDVEVGDEISLFLTSSNIRGISRFYEVIEVKDDHVVWDLGHLKKKRPNLSEFYVARMKKSKDYKLDQELDDDEDLL